MKIIARPLMYLCTVCSGAWAALGIHTGIGECAVPVLGFAILAMLYRVAAE